MNPNDKKSFIHQVPIIDESFGRPCFCVGPQNGEPLCPCRMKQVVIKNGRYVIPERDLGPVKEKPCTSS